MTTTPITNATISARIVWHMAQGKDIRAAYEAVLGAGSWDALVDVLYEACQQPQAA